MLQSREILTVAETQAADHAAAAAGVSVDVLMERAGTAVAEAIIARWSPRPALLLCGPGNNGGDGYVAARKLAEAGWPVTVAQMGDPVRLKGEAARAAALWRGETIPLGKADPAAFGLVVDALFGAGLSRPLSGAVEQALRRCEGRPVVAVDLPSGLAGDSGRPLNFALKAALTVTFHAKKPAHVLEPGRGLCGEVVTADIGVPAGAAPRTRLWENGDALWASRLPWPSAGAHKHARGRMVVVSGPMWSTGAARLSARSGLRAGAGLVTVLSPTGALAVNAAQLEAVMVHGFETDAELERAAAEADAAVIGPGAGVNNATMLNLMALARTGAALVVDADALTVFRDDPETLFSLLDRDDVLTPHVGEFERVFPGVLEGSPDKVTATRRAAAQAGAVVLLKGPDTVIAAPDGRAAVNTNAQAWLATAGSGDVLAGLIAGLLAQGMDSFEAACAAAWIHGEAGSAFGPGLIAEDLPGLVPPVLKRLWEARGG
ncbi:MAG: bifunctional ADP-dependent NAD(P)H-hydrate dehydratase/NAD(P)H-hydrate epimerase [Caulobacterales bacterium 32-69-10]|nr:MAG: bifunctional ADP-dependent NAD(P)H-hydrate dehydratase/NAD(P)H-hydrate epimerase [Caulobacterales bacterium 32-69-10]